MNAVVRAGSCSSRLVAARPGPRDRRELFVLDGSKALHKAVGQVFGSA